MTIDQPQGIPESFGQAHGGWTAAPTVAAIIGRIGPLLGLPPRGDVAGRWFRERTVEGEAFNGRLEQLEKSFGAAANVRWHEGDAGGEGCGCGPCSVVG